MNFSLQKITGEDLLQFKRDMQEAFQKGFEDVYGKTENTTGRFEKNKPSYCIFWE